MSSHLQWLIIRNNSSFLLKGAHGQTFSTEANNLKGKNSFRFNGLVHNKSVGVSVKSDNEGGKLVLTTQKSSAKGKPAKSQNKVEFRLKSGSRRILNKIRSTISKTRYRKDLKLTALRRASALIRGTKQRKAVAAADKKQTKKAE